MAGSIWAGMTETLALVSIVYLTLWFLIVKSANHGSKPASAEPRNKGVSSEQSVSTTCTVFGFAVMASLSTCVTCDVSSWA